MGCCSSTENDRNSVGRTNAPLVDDVTEAAGLLLGKDHATARVELSLSCRNLQDKDFIGKSDPFVVVYKRVGGNNVNIGWTEIGRTEIVANNLNPQFVTKIYTSYNFEQQEFLKFIVYDCDTSFQSSDASKIDLSKQDFEGMAETSLAGIISSSVKGPWVGSLVSHRGKPRGEIIIIAEELAKSNYDVAAAFRISNLLHGNRTRPFLRFSKLREDGGYTPCYRSEVAKGSLYPVFKNVNTSLLQLCNGDVYRPIKVELFDWERNGSHRLLGECEVSVDKLSKIAGGSADTASSADGVPIIDKAKQRTDKKYQNSGFLFCDSFEVIAKPSFLTYIKGGAEVRHL